MGRMKLVKSETKPLKGSDRKDPYVSYRIVVPTHVVEALGWKDGQRLTPRAHLGRLIIQKARAYQ